MEHVRSRRSPKCARCRNHGSSVPLRGHAGRCRFARCVCWKCALITERTWITARQREAGATGGGVTEPDGVEEDQTYTCTRAPETARPRGDVITAKPTANQQQPRVPWDYVTPHTPLNAVHFGDLPLAMALPLHGHYAGTLAQPGFVVRFGVPALGPVTFPHFPPAALVEDRQEAPGVFYVPYLPHPHPDLHPPGVWEPVHGPDSGIAEGGRQRSSSPPGGALQSIQE